MGYRTGRVGRRALYASLAAGAGAVVLVAHLSALVLLAGVLGVPVARDVLVQFLFAPPVVGFVLGVMSVFAVVLAGVTGLVCGAVGGAVSRLADGHTT